MQNVSNPVHAQGSLSSNLHYPSQSRAMPSYQAEQQSQQSHPQQLNPYHTQHPLQRDHGQIHASTQSQQYPGQQYSQQDRPQLPLQQEYRQQPAHHYEQPFSTPQQQYHNLWTENVGQEQRHNIPFQQNQQQQDMMQVKPAKPGPPRPAKPPASKQPKQATNFLFVDATEGSTPGSGKQSRRNARSFVMQKARRARPWSTAKGSANSAKSGAAAATAAAAAATALSQRSTSDNLSASRTGPAEEEMAKTAPSRATSGISRAPTVTKDSSPDSTSSVTSVSSRTRYSPRSPTLDFIVNPPQADVQHDSVLRRRKQAHALVRARELDMELMNDPRTMQCVECRSALIHNGAQRWCKRCEYARVAAANNSRDHFVDGSLDPFGVMPIAMDPKTAKLTTHWLRVLSPGAIPIDINHKSSQVRKSVFNMSLNSKGAMHGLICSAALHSMILGRATIVDVMHHKQMAIAEVNKALQDPALCVSDGNIFAVFTLLCLEESMMLPMFKKPEQTQNEAAQRMVHLMGLKRMIEMRGGLRALTSAPLLQAFVIWHAVAHSVASFYPPYLDFGLSEHDASYPHAPNFTYPACYFVFTHLGHALCVHSQLIRIAQDLSLYTVQMEDWFGNPVSKEDPVDLQNRGCLLECRLLDFFTTPDSAREHDSVEDSICLGLLAYVSTIKQTRDRSFEPMQLVALKKMKACLQQTRADKWVRFPLALLWTLVAGAMTSSGAIEAPWFAAQIRRACSLFGIKSFNHMVAHMEQLLWLDTRTAQPVARMWETITDRENRAMWTEKADTGIFGGMPFFGPLVPDPTSHMTLSGTSDHISVSPSPSSESGKGRSRTSTSPSDPARRGLSTDFATNLDGEFNHEGTGGVPGVTSKSPSLASRNLPFRVLNDERRDETYIFNDVGYDAVRIWGQEEFQPPAPQTVDRRQQEPLRSSARTENYSSGTAVFIPPTTEMTEFNGSRSNSGRNTPRRTSLGVVPAMRREDSATNLWSIENISLLPKLEQILGDSHVEIKPVQSIEQRSGTVSEHGKMQIDADDDADLAQRRLDAERNKAVNHMVWRRTESGMGYE